jgi:hypothetical protein
MSVDFYQCSVCKESVYEENVHSCECGERVCFECLDEKQYPNYKLGNVEDFWKMMTEIEEKTGDYLLPCCPSCKGENITESDMLRHVLAKYKLNREEIKQEMLNLRKGGK